MSESTLALENRLQWLPFAMAGLCSVARGGGLGFGACQRDCVRNLQVPCGGTWGFPQSCACHVAQATGGRLPRLSKRKMKVTHQLASPSRSEVAQPHGRRCHLQRSKVKSAVVHETKRGLDASPVDATPECDGRMCNAVQCTQQASGDGNGSQPC